MRQGFRPLIELVRSDVAEVVVHGAVAWAHGNEVIRTFGEATVFGRSLVKPFQARVFANELASLTAGQQALVCASHAGTPRHVEIARSILPPEHHDALLLPPAPPLGGGGPASQWTHPCSGKHAGLVRGCLARGWPVHGYLAADHPHHEHFIGEVRRLLGGGWSPLTTATDGCGLPTETFALTDLARLFAGLARTRAEDWIWSVMTGEPELVGGEGRLDTDVMRTAPGRVVAKEGADGLLALSIADERWPDGLGVVIKIAHGHDTTALRRVAHKILDSLGISIADAPHPHGQVVRIEEAVGCLSPK